MSNWTHSLCSNCWWRDDRFGDREPIRVRDAPEERCCGCGKQTDSGIYVRGNPAGFAACAGHDD